jgi:hypothetical protein
MDTSIPTNEHGTFVSRLQQAIRVMEGASKMPNTVFDIDVFAVREGDTLRACIAGLCGLDPWFQAQGLTPIFGGATGGVSISPEKFFGTETPFFRSNYGPEFSGRDITVPDAVAALKEAIAKFDALPADPQQATA